MSQCEVQCEVQVGSINSGSNWFQFRPEFNGSNGSGIPSGNR